MNEFRPWQEQIRWLPCDNVDVTTPGFSLVRVTGVDATTGNLKVQMPNADGQDVLATGPQTMVAGASGWCTADWPAYVQYDPAGGVPRAGDTWGAKAGSFLLTKTKAGFTVAGGAQQGRTLVVRDPKECCGGGASAPGPGLQRARATGSGALFVGGMITFGFSSVRWDTGTPAFWSRSNPTKLVTPSAGHYLVGANVKFTINSGPPASRPSSLELRIDADGLPLASMVLPFNFAPAAITLQLTAAYDLGFPSAIGLSAFLDSNNTGLDQATMALNYATDLWAIKLA